MPVYGSVSVSSYRLVLTLVGLVIASLAIVIILVLLQRRLSSDTPVKHPLLSTLRSDLSVPSKKDVAMQLISAAENSSLNWRGQYSYIEYNVEKNATENRGYTGGIIGFTSRTGDMLDLINYYRTIEPGNRLEKYIPALQQVENSSSTVGLGQAFMTDWKIAASVPGSKFRIAQDYEQDTLYFIPAVSLAKADGLRALGQFMYYDAAVMHGLDGLAAIRVTALRQARTPIRGGEEAVYLNHFLDARKAEMLSEEGHSDTSRVDTMQRKLLRDANFDLTTPLTFSVYGNRYTIC